MSTDPLDALDGLFDAVGDFFSDVSKAFKSGPAETRAERERARTASPTSSTTPPTPPAPPAPPTPPTPPSPPRYVRNEPRSARPVRPERPQRTTATGASGGTGATPRTTIGNQVVGGRGASVTSSIRTGRSGDSEGEVTIGAGSRSTSMQVHSAGTFTVSADRPSKEHTIAFRGDRVLVDGTDVTEFLRTAARDRDGAGQ